METSVVDLTIIGAGPTGLLSAVLARKLGLSVCIVEKRDGPLQVGRADALNARTQQVLEVVGVLPELTPYGLKCNTSSTFKEGKFVSRNSHWWTGLKNTHYKEFLMIGQSEVEKALLKHLDIPVRYGVTAVSLEEDADGVTTGCGNNDVIRSKYVIAADGAHSPCRKLLTVSFTGVKPNMRWAVLDTFIKTDFPVASQIITFELDGQSRVAWIPRERGMARFYILLEGEVNQERSEESIQRHLAPYKVEFERTEWFSTFDVEERVAGTFISEKGRTIFAGDSAHVHSVNGGQGLNTGIADAFALVWRLSLLFKGFDKSILHTYNTERRDTALGVIDVAANLVRSTLRTAEEYVKIIEKSAANITGMGITYKPLTPLVVEGTFASFTAGACCPDFTLTQQKNGETIRFYETFEYGKFLVFRPKKLQQQQQVLLPAWTQSVKVWEVVHEEGADNIFTITHEEEEKYTTNFELGKDVVIVVRPDLYVGYVGVDLIGYFSAILF